MSVEKIQALRRSIGVARTYLPQELLAAREYLGLSRAELSDFLELRPGEDSGTRTVRRWETGHWPVPYSVTVAVRILVARRMRDSIDSKLPPENSAEDAG